MASGYSPWWRRLTLKLFPENFIECPGGNYHTKTETTCCCVRGENGQGDYHYDEDAKTWWPVREEAPRFTIECSMEERWIPHFLGMLKAMESFGSMGCSRRITFYSDGDGDYRPKFTWADTLPDPETGIDAIEAKLAQPWQGDLFFDAG